MSRPSRAFAVASEIPAPEDVMALLRSYARAARKAYPHQRIALQAERLAIMAEARASIDRINAPD